MSDLWFGKSEAAELLGREEAFIRDQVIPRLAADEKKKLSARGSPWRLHGPAVVRAYTEWLAETQTGDPSAYSTANSPALERQREARARLLEYELAERRRQLISVELFQAATATAFLPLRKFAEGQIKEHGNGTADTWNEAVEDFAKAIESAIGQPINTDGAGDVSGTTESPDSATSGATD